MKRALTILFAAVCLSAASSAAAADRYALVVSGAAGSPDYQRQYDGWRTTFTGVLRATCLMADDHLIVLGDSADPNVRKPTRENIRAAFGALRQKASKDDLVLIMLIGHGNASESSIGAAKFNLVGPDLSAREWADLVGGLPSRVVFVNGASGSAPFLQTLSARGRIVITATDTSAQEYETIFPEFFITAFTAGEADADKNGKVSIWEAFAYASASVRQWYQQQGRLQTERALLDDDGDGVGREAQSPGTDGTLALATFLQPDAPASSTPPANPSLSGRRVEIQAQIDRLRARRSEMTQEDYDAQMEQLLLELARVDADLRAR